MKDLFSGMVQNLSSTAWLKRRSWGKWVVPLLCLLLWTCKSDETPAISDTTYFPLHVGLYWVYDVAETDIYQTSCGDGGKTSLTYQIKVQVIDSTLNQEGSYTYTLYRFKRTDSTQPWANLDTWSVYISAGKVIANESNVLYVPLVFPFTQGLKWNGNQFNDQTEEDYSIANIRQSFSLPSGTKYNKTVTVVQSANDDLIVFQDMRSEVYAQQVGLVYKTTTQLHYFTDQSCLGLQKVQQGLIYTQSLSEYGHE